LNLPNTPNGNLYPDDAFKNNSPVSSEGTPRKRFSIIIAEKPRE
jgi:hypothetical protein